MSVMEVFGDVAVGMAYFAGVGLILSLIVLFINAMAAEEKSVYVDRWGSSMSESNYKLYATRKYEVIKSQGIDEVKAKELVLKDLNPSMKAWFRESVKSV